MENEVVFHCQLHCDLHQRLLLHYGYLYQYDFWYSSLGWKRKVGKGYRIIQLGFLLRNKGIGDEHFQADWHLLCWHWRTIWLLDYGRNHIWNDRGCTGIAQRCWICYYWWLDLCRSALSMQFISILMIHSMMWWVLLIKSPVLVVNVSLKRRLSSVIYSNLPLSVVFIPLNLPFAGNFA